MCISVLQLARNVGIAAFAHHRRLNVITSVIWCNLSWSDGERRWSARYTSVWGQGHLVFTNYLLTGLSWVLFEQIGWCPGLIPGQGCWGGRHEKTFDVKEYLPSCPSNRCVDTSFCYRKHEQFKENLLWPAHQRSKAHHINFPGSCHQWWQGKPTPFTRDLPPFSQWSGTIPTAPHYPDWTGDYPYLLIIATLAVKCITGAHSKGGHDFFSHPHPSIWWHRSWTCLHLYKLFLSIHSHVTHLYTCIQS